MIEIQIHPSDIRRRVRYFFLDRRRVVVGLIVLSFVLAGLIGSMAAAPTVIRRVYKTNYLYQQRQERGIQRERLRENVVQMTSLERSLEEHRIRVEKLITVYGLDRTLGQGGFSTPNRIADVPLDDARRREISLKNAMRRLQQQLDVLAAYEAANRELVRHTPSILPVPDDRFVLTSPFGNRVSPFTRATDFHKGLDLSAPTGTAVYATADGVVTFAGRYPIRQSVAWWRFGNVVTIKHADRFVTIYAHCDTVRVRAGQRVQQGEVIATVGNTGWSTNAHLHYEIRSDLEQPGTYVPIDPRIYILNYQWSNEALLLMRARTSKDYRNFEPLPSAFVGAASGGSVMGGKRRS
ncbi:MAG TPA: M23 family metallopeptidase [Thermoanaerobaculia bacterium]|jgi:murein DD-endopeptidase MepM/ murein hydrolase activator NlpD|nr:M23 family metallopeptidase [Thermoanaerobaculia bacterium]